MSGPARVHHADLYGTREAKYKTLAASDVSTTDWERLEPRSPRYIFKPWDNELEEEYEQWPKITEVMPVNSVGVVTGQDKVAIRWSRDETMRAMRNFAFPTDEEMDDKLVVQILYRPFDTRYTYYSGSVITRRREEVMRHMLAGKNLGLMFMRQVSVNDMYSHFGVSRHIVDNRTFYSNRGIMSSAPLYTYLPQQESPEKKGTQSRLNEPMKREHNFSSGYIKRLEESLGLRFVDEGRGDLYKTFGPEDTLHYIYAAFNSTAYRKRYDQFLRADFPRVPLTSDVDLFRSLADLGRRLVGVHLLEWPMPDTLPVSYPIVGDNTVERAHPKYFAPGDTPPGEDAPIERGRVYIGANGTGTRWEERGQYFEGIASEVWESRIGGYQPLHKWLSDRKGRALTFSDRDHYKLIVAALEATQCLTHEVDATILDAGWLV